MVSLILCAALLKRARVKHVLHFLLIVVASLFCSTFADDEEATFNAVQCLDTIDSVLEAVQEKPEVLALLEPITQPMIMK